jgi:hypothetical protein
VVVDFGSPLSSDAPKSRGFFSRRSRRFRFAFAAAAVAMIGATFAINITLNGQKGFEYGQGIYRIASCDQFVSVNLASTTAYDDGLSRVGNITLQGLDVGRCANTSIRLRLYDSSSSTPLNLFTNPTYTRNGITYPCCTDTGTAVILVFSASATQATALQSTSLISPSGKNINRGDRSQSLSYDSPSGTFTIAFDTPLAIMRDVYRTTLESASNV